MKQETEFNPNQWKNIWTLAEHKNGKLRPVSFELLGRGRALADERNCQLCTVVMGDQISERDLQELIERGSDQVYLVEDKRLKNFLVDPQASIFIDLIERYHPEVVIAAAKTTGRTLMPYVAAQIHAGLTADCTGLAIDKQTGCLLQTRPAIGGNILATIKTPTARPQMATVRPKSTRIPDRVPGRTGAITRIDKVGHLMASRVIFEKFVEDANGEASIEDADIVIAGGAGVRKAEGFDVIDKLAALLGGAVGATRPCVDHGWKPYPDQVGLSGKTISPKLYVACGISGAIQHLAGIQTAENIIAINSDPNAPIFQVADLAIVGNLFEILPVLAEEIRQLKGSS